MHSLREELHWQVSATAIETFNQLRTQALDFIRCNTGSITNKTYHFGFVSLEIRQPVLSINNMLFAVNQTATNLFVLALLHCCPEKPIEQQTSVLNIDLTHGTMMEVEKSNQNTYRF